MKYRFDKYNHQISLLGFGCMRFPQKFGKIDIEETEKEIMTAIEHGVNYFDTAYIYPGHEEIVGRIIEKNGIRATVRRTLGEDINASCGQLRRNASENKE